MLLAVEVLGGSLNLLRGIQAEIQGLQILTLRGTQQKATACTQALRRAGARWRIKSFKDRRKKASLGFVGPSPFLKDDGV